MFKLRFKTGKKQTRLVGGEQLKKTLEVKMDLDVRTLIPAWELKREEIARVKKAAREALYNIFMTGTRYPNPIIRDLTAEDLGLNQWITPTQKQGEWSFWVEKVVRELRFIAIYKITQLTQNPKVHTMRVSIAHTVKGIYDLDTMYGTLPILHKLDEFKDEKGLSLTFAGLEEIRMEAYLPTVCLIPEDTYVGIETVSSFDNEGDWLVLGGYVIEPNGMCVA